MAPGEAPRLEAAPPRPPAPTPPPPAANDRGRATLAGLERWAREPALSSVESQQRRKVVEVVCRQAPAASARPDAPIHIRHSLVLAGLDAITSLPEGLDVGGTLCIADCTRLRALPRGLRVAGTLIAEGCISLATIDPDAELLGDLQLGGCASLTALPETLLRRPLGRIPVWDLRGTGVSQEVGRKLRPHAHPQLDPAGVAEPVRALACARDAHRFWRQACPDSELAPPATWVGAGLLALSERLQASAHYAQPQVRPSLALRVLALFAADPEAAVEVEDEIQRALAAGDDLMMTTLPRLEEICAVHHALRGPEPKAALRAVGLGMLTRSVLAEVASEHAAALRGCDSMEVGLAYAAGLADRLPGLAPTCYPRGQLAAIDAACLARAACRVEKTVAAMEASAMAAWAPLQRHGRAEAARALDMGGLAILPQALHPDVVCPITQAAAADLQRPVAVVRAGTATLYERDALLRWWVEHGVDPMQQRMDLTMLRRVAWMPVVEPSLRRPISPHRPGSRPAAGPTCPETAGGGGPVSPPRR